MRTRIDPLIKPLVVNLNRLSGVTTNGSCQGHVDERKPYVSMICEEQSMWPILAAVETINGEERKQIRAQRRSADVRLSGLKVSGGFGDPSVSALCR